jgi:hypothetical protein
MLKTFLFLLSLVLMTGCSMAPTSVESSPDFDEVIKKQKLSLPNGYAIQSFRNILLPMDYDYDIYKGTCVDSFLPIGHYFYSDHYYSNFNKGKYGFCFQTNEKGENEIFIAEDTFLTGDHLEIIKDIISKISAGNKTLEESGDI